MKEKAGDIGNRSLIEKKKEVPCGAGLEKFQGEGLQTNKTKQTNKKKIEFIVYLVHLKISGLDDRAFKGVFGKFSQWICKKN